MIRIAHVIEQILHVTQLHHTEHQMKNSWMQDPRCKHEYLDSRNVHNLNNDWGKKDESDKHLEARDPRYSCLISEAADTRVN